MADKPDDVSALSICPKLVVPEMAGPEMTEPDIEWSETLQRIRVRTPARLLVGRAGAAYRTHTQLELRKAHAAARDAVGDELDLEEDFGTAFIERWKLFEVSTQATSKQEYLLRPDLGRCLTESSRSDLLQRVSSANDLQIVIGDGLSVIAISQQAPPLLELLYQHARERAWRIGQPFVIRHCRVGVLNDIGSLLAPRVVILLIGERPGLATAESLSAYLAYRPGRGDTDANRNLISNIHSRGVGMHDAARRIINLAARMMTQGASGYQVREELLSPTNAEIVVPGPRLNDSTR
jgi:ethanolamine ammonia-lyase small subunit